MDLCGNQSTFLKCPLLRRRVSQRIIKSDMHRLIKSGPFNRFTNSDWNCNFNCKLKSAVENVNWGNSMRRTAKALPRKLYKTEFFDYLRRKTRRFGLDGDDVERRRLRSRIRLAGRSERSWKKISSYGKHTRFHYYSVPNHFASDMADRLFQNSVLVSPGKFVKKTYTNKSIRSSVFWTVFRNLLYVQLAHVNYACDYWK